MLHIPRNTGQRSGGVGIIYNNYLDIIVVSHDSCFSSFEHTEHLLKFCTWIRLIFIYKPPTSSANGLTVAQFLGELYIFPKCSVVLPANILIMGDFNFRVDQDPQRINDSLGYLQFIATYR